MYSFELTQSIARAIVTSLLNRKTKKVKCKNKNEQDTEITCSDFIDYDGMGNYSRFPCIKK